MITTEKGQIHPLKRKNRDIVFFTLDLSCIRLNLFFDVLLKNFKSK